ncbi:hypothetical protein TSAR_000892, partial [Trichomalopsis sarcophagae]
KTLSVLSEKLRKVEPGQPGELKVILCRNDDAHERERADVKAHAIGR